MEKRKGRWPLAPASSPEGAEAWFYPAHGGARVPLQASAWGSFEEARTDVREEFFQGYFRRFGCFVCQNMYDW